MKHNKSFRGLVKFFSNRNYSRSVWVKKDVLEEMVKDYCIDVHDYNGSVNECADLIQNNFQDFVNWVRKTDKTYNLI